jgi:hypothetical protein
MLDFYWDRNYPLDYHLSLTFEFSLFLRSLTLSLLKELGHYPCHRTILRDNIKLPHSHSHFNPSGGEVYPSVA